MKFYIVDVFAEYKYQGNQLAVLIPDYELSIAEMQQIAREINFSETSFILSDRPINNGYEVKIFTPDVEVPFAGHPTLGTAYIIHRMIESEKSHAIYLSLAVGTIPISIDNDVLTMTQNQPCFGMTIEDTGVMADILKIDKDDICNNYPIQVVSTGLPCAVVPLKSLDALKRCSINHEGFQHFIENVYKCNLLVFAPDVKEDLRVRVFMDDPGFLEDPATGSANGNLAGYLLKYNYFNKSNVNYNVIQGVEINRPSSIRISAEVADGVFKIQVGGKVHLIAAGEWL